MGIVETSFAQFKESTLSTEAILMTFVNKFEQSTAFRLMAEGNAYYRGENAILNRKIMRYVDDAPVEDPEATNNKVSHPYMRLAVDEKVSYLLGKSPTFSVRDGGSPELVKQLNEVFDDEFDDVLVDIGVEASNSGIAWLHGFMDVDPDEENVLGWMSVPADQVIPLWGDDAHRKLEGVMRRYSIIEYAGAVEKTVKKVEYWTADDVTYYIDEGGSLFPDMDREPTGLPVGHFKDSSGEQYSWGVVPFIPFKNNSLELPDLYAVKTIIDDYDNKTSDTSNLIEDIQNFVYVLKNYSGQSLTEFQTNLRRYKAIKVDDEGGVEKVTADLNPTAVEAHLDRLKSDFYQFGQSVDRGLDAIGGAPSGVALEFLYSGLGMKADKMERKFKRSFKILFQMVVKFLEVTKKGDFDWRDANVTFTRSTITNVVEMLGAVNTATATHSKRTALENSPWVSDVDDEFKRIAQEEKDSYGNEFKTPDPLATEDPAPIVGDKTAAGTEDPTKTTQE